MVYLDNEIEKGDISVAKLETTNAHESALEQLDMNNVAPVACSSPHVLESDFEADTESDVNSNSSPEVQETSTSTNDEICRACPWIARSRLGTMVGVFIHFLTVEISKL